MSDRVPQRDNYGDDGETPRDRQQGRPRTSDRTSGDRSSGGCCCGGGGGCCCHMRNEAFDRSDPLRAQRHAEAKRHMEEVTRGDCPGDQAVPRHRRPTQHDQVCDPDHHMRHHHRRHHQHHGWYQQQPQYGEYGPTGNDRMRPPRVPIPNQNGVDYSGDNYGRYGSTNGGNYRVIDGAPGGGNLYYDSQGRPHDANGRAINMNQPPEQITGTDRYGRPVDQYGRVVGQQDMDNMVVDYDRQGRPLDKYGRVLVNGPQRNDGGVQYDQYGRAIDQYGNVIGGGSQNQRYDQYGRLCDEYGRPIGNSSAGYDQYGRPVDQYGRPLDGGRQQIAGYDQNGRPVDQYGRPLDGGRQQIAGYDQYGRAVDQYGRPIDGGRQQVTSYDQYGRPVDQYGRPLDGYGRQQSQIVGYDTYGRPVDQYGRVVSGAGGDPWQRNNTDYYSSRDWYRNHPDRQPWDERIPGYDQWGRPIGSYGRYGGNYGRYGGNYGRDGVYMGIGPDGQFQIGVQTNGVRIGVGDNNYGRGRYGGYPYRSGEDYNDYYGQYLDPNGRGGRYYRQPVYDYNSGYNGYNRYDSRYAYRHGNGVDINTVLPLGNGGVIGIDLNNIQRMFR